MSTVSASEGNFMPSEEELAAKCFELGLFMESEHPGVLTHPDVTLQSCVMHKVILQKLYDLQLLWNEAVDKTARNYSFLSTALRDTAMSDREFTGRLVRMMEEVYLTPPRTSREGAPQAPVFQRLMLGIFRTDYMRSLEGDAEAPAETVEQWKNVEINTISCSFAGLSPMVGAFHKYLRAYHGARSAGQGVAEGEVEVSISGMAVPAALARAAKAWQEVVPFEALCSLETQWVTNGGGSSLQSAVVVVIQEGERNTADQYKLLFALLEVHGVLSIRLTLSQLAESMRLVDVQGDATNSLPPCGPFAVIDNRYVASVVYFRSTYVPADFSTEATWVVRAAIERSNAIKCPSLPYHLMTFKKLQQMMTDVENVLTPISFHGDREKAAKLARQFVGQYSLNAADYPQKTEQLGVTADPERYIQDAVHNPEAYVLKPQLEGGGNLFAGEEMRKLLRDATADAQPELFSRIRKEYILMQKIRYPKRSGVILRRGACHALPNNLCSELGIFGIILSDGTSAGDPSLMEGGKSMSSLFNEHAGYVVRSKPADKEDGGVMAGAASLDALALIA